MWASKQAGKMWITFHVGLEARLQNGKTLNVGLGAAYNTSVMHAKRMMAERSPTTWVHYYNTDKNVQ